ncbi:MAG TPA: T9SS type A sorting domain-containing protein [Flavobacterium sp.]|uniref:T9SS-dependent choice-of-anchor J family protein n=1 Tax=Flavobacterium sp. TaxID=239 RepID=UPI002D11BE4D|nr:T9SS type A sorting domain-containing protein [Flavobacterium sp.]HSD13746.1 T9SS type A sorting domain-containing protein [Flavobacterium sp.]
MKKILLLSSLFFSSLGFSQVTLFQDSFETYGDFLITGFGQWGTLDLDLLTTYTGGTDTPTWANAGAPQAFQIFNPSTAGVVNETNGCSSSTENSNFTSRTGAKYAACWAGVPTASVLANNDWLISPPISLAGATGTQLSFWYKALSDCYGAERFRVGVYIGTGNPTQVSDFTIISGVPPIQATSYTAWTEQTFPLTTYNGLTIRIGIQCVSPDRYMLMVDDFKVTATTLSTDSFTSSKFSVYPNPANNVVNVSNNGNIQINKVSIVDINGRIVKAMDFESVTETQIGISELNQGVYFMNIDTNEGIVTKKIVKK